MKNSMINSKEYWDDLFIKNEKNKEREEQTKFFVRLAISHLPKWLIEDIEDGQMSICDAGCAEGDGTKILSEQFPNNCVTGIDFSTNAIEWAKEKYKECEFEVDSIKNLSKRYDVIFSSNVLEHFYNSDKLIEELASKSEKYCILLLPFREYYTIPEHFSYFDFSSFPLELNHEYELCYFKPITMVGEQQKYWFGEQILIVYGKKEHLETMKLSLRNLYNGYVEERTEIIKEYNEKIEKLELEIKEKDKSLECLEEEKEKERQAQKKIKQYEEENRKYKERIDSYEKRNLMVEGEIKSISIVQSGTIYKMGLALKRFIMQCFRTREKKDFAKWIWGKVIRKDMHAKPLSEFDLLEKIKGQLRLTAQPKVVNSAVINNPNFVLKNTDSVVIFASVPFYDVGGGQRSAQFAKTFNLMGYKVYYIYGFPCTEENIPDMFIPTVAHEYIDDISIEWFEEIVNANTMILFEIPYYKFEPYLDLAKEKGCHTIYEHIDNWDSSLGCMFYDEKVFKQFLEKTDRITVTAKKLGEKIEEYSKKDYLYLPNAVNTEIFEPSKSYEYPKDLVKGKNKTLLYFGSLWGEWFEWEKIDYIAEKCPDCEINLIGDYSGCTDRLRKARKNVHFLGLKKQTELPAYLKYSDIALLPFKNCEIGKYVSPLKIFEYIAMNIKVLATNLDDIQGYPNVYCSDSKEDWVKMVNEDTELTDSSVFISENNWFARCEKLIQCTSSEVERKKSSVSVIVLNYNNMKVIRRCVDTLLAHKKRYNYEIIVVDNDSTDGSYEMLEKEYAESIILLKNKKNGCSSGRNLGADHATGTYLCFLDSDQWIVSDYWLDNALQILEEGDKIGAVAWNAGWFTPGKTTGEIVDYLPNRGIEAAVVWYRTDIAYLATSGFVMRTEVFQAIEGFDEFYDPTCFEDTDISLKVRHYGLELAYCPYMGIMHLPHQTTQSGSASHTKLMKKNGEYFKDKWEKMQPELLEYYY